MPKVGSSGLLIPTPGRRQEERRRDRVRRWQLRLGLGVVQGWRTPTILSD